MLSLRFVLVIGLFFLAIGVKAENQVRFLIYHQSAPPYFFFDEEQHQFYGLVPDILAEAAEAHDFSVELISENRQRAELALYQGSADAMLLSPQWAERPKDLLFTDSFHQHRNYLYSLAPFDAAVPYAEVLQGQSVCARQGYVYPGLEMYFVQHQALRMDISDQAQMFSMLAAKRCQFAYMSEFRAQWLMRHRYPDLRIYRSSDALEQAPNSFAISKHQEWLRQALNQTITELRQQQRIQALLQQYLQRPIKIAVNGSTKNTPSM